MTDVVIEYLWFLAKAFTVYIFAYGFVNFTLNSYFDRKKKLTSEYLKAGSEALNKIVERKKEKQITMDLYIAERQSGKTTMLIKMSAETGAIIVAPNHLMASYIVKMAIKLGINIPTPITVNDYIHILSMGGLNKTQKYLIDELQMALHRMNVEAATFDNNYVIFGVKDKDNT